MGKLGYTEVGRVKGIRGCIVTIEGLNSTINGQLVNFGFGTFGTVLGFDQKETQVLIIKESTSIKTGDEVRTSLEPFNVPVGEKFIGRILLFKSFISDMSFLPKSSSYAYHTNCS